jgi:hypothetical protein
MLTVLGGLAEFERELIKARTERGAGGLRRGGFGLAGSSNLPPTKFRKRSREGLPAKLSLKSAATTMSHIQRFRDLGKYHEAEIRVCCAGAFNLGDIGRCDDGPDETPPHAAKAPDANVPGRRSQSRVSMRCEGCRYDVQTSSLQHGPMVPSDGWRLHAVRPPNPPQRAVPSRPQLRQRSPLGIASAQRPLTRVC